MGFSPAYYAYRRTSSSDTNKSDGDYTQECLYKDSFCVNRLDGKKIGLESNSPLVETVKQLCAFEQGIETWYSYVSQFADDCFEYDSSLKKQVLVENLAVCGAKIDVPNKDQINNCTNEVFSAKNPLETAVIKHNMKKLEFFHTEIIPSIVINGETLKGELTESAILADICESISPKIKQCLNLSKIKEEKVMTNSFGDSNFSAKYIAKIA